MRHRGVTLLELLIVIALLLGAAALVLPALSDQLAERSFASSVELVEAHLLLARAEAMTRGRTLEVRWRPETRELVVIEFDPPRDSLQLADAAGQDESSAAHHDFAALDATMTGKLLPLPDSAEADSESAAPILSLQLPREIEITHELSRFSVNDPDSEAERFEMDEDAADRRPLRVAVYLRDGSALLARTLWLSDVTDSSRLVECAINPWTGFPRIERVEPEVQSDDAFARGSSLFDGGFAVEDGEDLR